jgi:hypothetical protein
VPLGFTDTADTTCLHVPSIGLIVAGDATYNGVHLHQSPSPDQQKRQEWIAALDKVESLKLRAVIAGHKRVGNDDNPKVLGETREYIGDFERLAMQTTSARELYDQMLKLYPDWGNRGALWSSVHAIKTQSVLSASSSDANFRGGISEPMKVAVLNDYQNVALVATLVNES